MAIEDLSYKKLDNIFDELIYDAISEDKEITMESSGNCMEPLIKDGDKISFRKVDINKLKRLDLILFKKRNNYISHRFVKTICKNGHIYILTRADISRKYDHPIIEKDFVGLITKIEKPDKIIYLNTLEGRLASFINIFIAPLCLLKQKKEYKNENELLKLVSRTNMDKNSIARAKELISNELNWSYVSERIRWGFIAPFFLKNIINSEVKNLVPSEIEERVRQICHWQLFHDTKVYSELKNVLSAFNGNKIKVMIIKGAQLGEEIYGDTFFRWMGDVDILAKLNDWPKIKNILGELGFKLRKHEYDYWGLKYSDNHITFFKKGIKLELKFSIWPMDFPFFKNDWWQGARRMILAGEEVLVPSIEDTLLIACLNLTRHNYSGLIWFCDIREILGRFREAIDWDMVITRAKEKNIDCMAYYALYYSSKLLKFKLPESILKRLKPPFIKRKLHNFFWDGKIILWKRQGNPVRAKIPFEIAVLLFGGKISFKPKKLLKMFLYINNVVTHRRGYFRSFLIMLDSLTAIILGRRTN